MTPPGKADRHQIDPIVLDGLDILPGWLRPDIYIRAFDVAQDDFRVPRQDLLNRGVELVVFLFELTFQGHVDATCDLHPVFRQGIRANGCDRFIDAVIDQYFFRRRQYRKGAAYLGNHLIVKTVIYRCFFSFAQNVSNDVHHLLLFSHGFEINDDKRQIEFIQFLD